MFVSPHWLWLQCLCDYGGLISLWNFTHRFCVSIQKCVWLFSGLIYAWNWILFLCLYTRDLTTVCVCVCVFCVFVCVCVWLFIGLIYVWNWIQFFCLYESDLIAVFCLFLFCFLCDSSVNWSLCGSDRGVLKLTVWIRSQLLAKTLWLSYELASWCVNYS